MKEKKTSSPTGTPQKPAAVQTTGHAWDGDLQEFNNPLPRWWVWTFYATVVFAVLYWFIYPTWPVGGSWTKGFSSISYTTDGVEHETRWNSRSLLIEELHHSTAALQQKDLMDTVGPMSFDEISNSPELLAFARAAGARLFGDNCAACHGAGGQGVIGQFPNLSDDAWLWGGTMEDIHETLVNGRTGFMPAYKETFTPDQAEDVAHYELSLSGDEVDSEAAERGKLLFQGPGGGCYQCHGMDGKGLASQGAANLTDKIWTMTNVPGQQTAEDKIAQVKNLIWNGVPWGVRKMPAWKDRLTPTDIKILTVYVHELGGGQ